jgi:hypothetical protein
MNGELLKIAVVPLFSPFFFSFSVTAFIENAITLVYQAQLDKTWAFWISTFLRESNQHIFSFI